MVRGTAQHYPFLPSPSLQEKKRKEKKTQGADICSSHTPKPNSLGSVMITLRLSAWAEFPFIEKATVTKQN